MIGDTEMPRVSKNMENTKKNVNIAISNLSINNIEENDCQALELYISGIDSKTWYIIQYFYRGTIKGESVSRRIKNSWKGLIQFLLSILYCKVGGKIVRFQVEYGFSKYIRVDHDFELLKTAIINNNPEIEVLFTPKSYKPIYIRSNYTNRDIIETILALCKALNVNIKKSKVVVKPSQCKIKTFEEKPIKEKVDNSNMICSFLDNCFNQGIAFVTRDTMKSLLDDCRILVAHPIKTPQQMKDYNENEWDCTYPYKFLSYPILKRYEEQLVKYFPLHESSIKHYAQKTDKFEYALNSEYNYLELNCDYIITDFIEMGRWG